MIFQTNGDTVGNTPLVELQRIGKDLPARLMCKLESRNPSGSVKDRIGVAMIEDAERRGVLRPGGTIVEATSGNTGIALAFAAAAKNYRLILTMPERMSKERILLLQYLGAQVVLTPGTLMRDAVTRAAELTAQIPGAIHIQQFKNPANPEIHRRTTAQEIWIDTKGGVDIFVSGVGTGGTITGVGEVLKERKPQVQIVAVEPVNAAVLSDKEPGNHLIQRIGADFIPEILNRKIIDEIIPMNENDAFANAKRLAREENIPTNISSNAMLSAALKITTHPKNQNKIVVFIIADNKKRYLSTPLFENLIEKKLTMTRETSRLTTSINTALTKLKKKNARTHFHLNPTKMRATFEQAREILFPKYNNKSSLPLHAIMKE